MKKNEFNIEIIKKLCNGIVKSVGNNQIITRFCNDTRELQNGDMFISIKPETGDGTKYIVESFEKGASGCITEYNLPDDIIEKYKDKIIIEVEDVIKAVQELAIYKRELYNIPVIGITGSVGKTTTKEMIWAVLSQKYNTAKPQNSYNNAIGVPLTILDWDDEVEVAIVEMGMNHLGEISELTHIAKPTIAVITNVGTAHIGILGSRENILKAKLEILEGLVNNGKIIINNDNDMLHNAKINNFDKITFGIENDSKYMAKNIKYNEKNTEYEIILKDKTYKIIVPGTGSHCVLNSLCAITVGDFLSVEMEKTIKAISEFQNIGKRSEITKINNLTIINDYFNANHDSMKAGLETLNKIGAKRRVAILGDMLELGEYSEELHRKVGKEVVKNNIDILITVGNLSKFIAEEAKKMGLKNAYSFDNNSECIANLNKIIKPNDTILIKASKCMWFGEIAKSIEGGNFNE